MSLNESAGRLERAAKELRLHFDRARDGWRDDRAAEVERRLLDPLDAATRRAADAMNRLAQAVAAARRDCSDG